MEGAGSPGARKSGSFDFTFNGGRVTAFDGDTVATALYRHGVRVYSRSMKFHRPRGLYCGAGRCISCVMRVNGVPAVRTCTTPVHRGMVVETERGFPTAGTDILSALDHIYRKQFDYHSKFVRPVFMAPFYQWLVRRLTSSSHIPDRKATFSPFLRRSCDVLLVGRGLSGSVAQARLESAGVRSLIVADRRVGHSGVPMTAFGFYESGEVGVQSDDGLQLVKAKSVILATGRQETGLGLVNGDLPGVFLPEAVNQLASRRISPGGRAVIVGENELREKVFKGLKACGTEIVAEVRDRSQIIRVEGRKRVTGVVQRQGSSGWRTLKCDLVVELGALVPAVGLAQQAGCELQCKDGLWSVKADREGNTSVPGVFACGGVAGLGGNDERIASGETAALSAIRFRGGV